jgi:hypothetical protein
MPIAVNELRYLPLEDLVMKLRRAAGIWFKNEDLLALEELIRRVHILLRQQNQETKNE